MEGARPLTVTPKFQLPIPKATGPQHQAPWELGVGRWKLAPRYAVTYSVSGLLFPFAAAE